MLLSPGTEGYSESLDHEVRTQGIRIVLVAPGVTRTAFEENITRADRPLRVYDAVRADAEKLMREIIETGDAPEVVADTVVKAANAASPKRRYTAGRAAGQVRFLRRFLPESIVDKNLRKFNQLPALTLRHRRMRSFRARLLVILERKRILMKFPYRPLIGEALPIKP